MVESLRIVTTPGLDGCAIALSTRFGILETSHGGQRVAKWIMSPLVTETKFPDDA